MSPIKSDPLGATAFLSLKRHPLAGMAAAQVQRAEPPGFFLPYWCG